VKLPPLRVRLTAKDWKQVERARASMAAFDAMPEAWRRICAEHGRTTNAVALARLLAECDGNIPLAAATLRDLLPVREP